MHWKSKCNGRVKKVIIERAHGMIQRPITNVHCKLCIHKHFRLKRPWEYSYCLQISCFRKNLKTSTKTILTPQSSRMKYPEKSRKITEKTMKNTRCNEANTNFCLIACTTKSISSSKLLHLLFLYICIWLFYYSILSFKREEGSIKY